MHTRNEGLLFRQAQTIFTFRTTDFSGRFCCGFTHRSGVPEQGLLVPLLDAQRLTPGTQRANFVLRTHI